MQSSYDPSRMANDRFVVKGELAAAGHKQSYDPIDAKGLQWFGSRPHWTRKTG